jgi:hypothetical protein
MPESLSIKQLTKEEVIENLKTMIFGMQAFERFNAEERKTLDRAMYFLEADKENANA